MFAAVKRLADRFLFQLKDSEPGEVVLVMRRVFILPTKAGYTFAALLLLMLVGSINYTLGLGFALTFFTGACAVADMYLTARNLAFLRLAPGRHAPVFAGEEAQFELFLHNPTPRDRFAIRLGFQTEGAPRQVTDVPSGGSSSVVLARPTSERGWLRPPRIRLATSFPLGLFGSWSYWMPDMKVLVYPHPESNAPPLPTTGAASEDGYGTVGLDNFGGIRSYQQGDPLRHLAWRQIARLDPALGGQLMTKHFEGGAVAELCLDFEQLPASLDLELRLSRMTQWVLEAERRSLPYSFRIGGRHFSVAIGDAHRASCLRALALYGAKDAA